MPSSYGNVAAVVVVVADLSFSVEVESLALLRPRDNSFVRVAFTPQISTPTTSMTDTAPMNEPSSVCLSSELVKNKEDVAGLDWKTSG